MFTWHACVCSHAAECKVAMDACVDAARIAGALDADEAVAEFLAEFNPPPASSNKAALQVKRLGWATVFHHGRRTFIHQCAKVRPQTFSLGGGGA